MITEDKSDVANFPHPIPPRRSITNERRTEPITHERARQAAMRFIHSHFGQRDHARITIPLNLDDDDVVLMDYIEQQLLADLRARRTESADVIQSEHDNLGSSCESLRAREPDVHATNHQTAGGDAMGQRERRGDAHGDRDGPGAEVPEP
jgi:hypothetical protein